MEEEIKKIKTSVNKSKCISCQKKRFTKLQKMMDTQSKIKPKKTGKKLGVKTLLIILGLKK